MRAGLAVIGFLLAFSGLRADRLSDIARMHLDVTGGAELNNALTAIRATGMIFMDGQRIRFSLLAARPNRIRLESEFEGRKFIQAYDGIETPWEFDSEGSGQRTRPMSEPAASRLVADAEYDGPLIAGKSRGYTVEFAGETERDGRPLLHLRVRYRFLETYSLLLNLETCLIEYRLDTQTSAAGHEEETVTRYDVYLPVDGVLLPHEITTLVDGKETQRMRIDRIDANPFLDAAIFSNPDLPVPRGTPGAN